MADGDAPSGLNRVWTALGAWRRELWRAVWVFIGCFVVTGTLGDDLLIWWRWPLVSIWSASKPPFALYGMMDRFFVQLSVCIYAAVLLWLPYVAWRLSVHVRRVRRGWWWGAVLLLYAGVAFGWGLVAPAAWRFLTTYASDDAGLFLSAPPDAHDLLQLSLTQYSALTLRLVAAVGLIAEAPYLLCLLARAGLVTPKIVARWRIPAYLVLLIVAAMLAPDPSLMLALAVLLVLLFELSLLVARLLAPRPSAVRS